MAVIDIKCECGHSYKTDFKTEDEIAFCEACGSLVINDLAPDIEDKIERVNQIKFEMDKLKKEKEKLELDIRIGLEGAPIGIGKKFQARYSSWESELLDQKKIKEDFSEEELRKYTYKSARDRITFKELK